LKQLKTAQQTSSLKAWTNFSSADICFFILVSSFALGNCHSVKSAATPNTVEHAVSQYRDRISINEGWKFMRYNAEPDKLIYDIRPEVTDWNDNAR